MTRHVMEGRKDKFTSAAILVLIIAIIWGIAESHPTPNGSGNVEIPKIPAMAQKAGGRLRPEFRQETENVKAPENNEKPDESSWIDESYSSEEKKCKRNKFYHIRGKRCVPLRCPGGRNQMTGRCIRDDDYSLNNQYRGWGRGRGLFRNHPAVWRSPPRPKSNRKLMKG